MSQNLAKNGKKSPRTPSLKSPEAILSTDRQQATGNRQQATGNRQQATGNRQQATGNRQLYTSLIKSCQLSNSIVKIKQFRIHSHLVNKPVGFI